MANEWDPDDVLDVWADERARQVLVAAAQEPASVSDLAEVCTGSLSSIYRRVEVLSSLDLLEEHVEIDGDGHHYNVYEPAFEDFRVRVADGSVVVEIEDSDGNGRTERLNPENDGE